MISPLFIGIVGGSGSGKSWLARQIRDRFAPDAAIVEQDWYYRDLSHLDPATAALTNFDRPDAIDAELFQGHLKALAAGRAVEAPCYRFATFSRERETRRVEALPLIVVEGLFAIHWPTIAALCQATVFVDTPSDLRLARRIRRDLSERGYELERILDFWESRARPMFKEYVEPLRDQATHRWNSEEDKAFVPAFLADLERRLARNAERPTA